MTEPDFGNERVSFFWSKALKKAEEILKSAKAILDLLKQAWELIEKVKGNKFLKELWNKITAMFRLVKAYSDGSFRDIPWNFLLLLVTAIVYFVSPVDAIPDIIPVVGFADDASVIAIIYNAIKPIIEKFIEWEKSRRS